MNEQEVQFPRYPAPLNPLDVQPGQQKPLMKLVKNLMKPMKQRDPFHSRKLRKTKKPKFY